MQKIRVFLNEHASQGAERDWKKLIRQRLFRSDLEFITPRSHAEFMQEIDRATRDKIDIIISVGGDGTIHGLIQKLADKKISFLVVPAGTANDFARSLGVSNMRVHEIISAVREGTPTPIDLIDINGTLMATNGGIGFIADIAANVNRYRKTVPGFRKLMSIAKQETYGAILVSTILSKKFEYFNIKVECDQFQSVIRTPLLMINNQPMIAANFPVAPTTKHDDGTFNVTIFLHQKPADFITSIIRVRRGINPENDPFILSFETTKIKLESADGKELNFMGDGEQLAKSSTFDVSIRPKALTVFGETVKAINLSDYSGEGEKS
ncbi:MAG: NAD(+)/NADH kinase [Oligoflexus sp.]|nr:NAD(+)/NADH kinase [Oligoflexus sp.]